MMGKVAFILAVVVAATLQMSPAFAQIARPWAGVQDLPVGELRRSIERLDSPARAETIRRLNQLAPSQADLDYLRVDSNGRLFYVDPPAPPAKPSSFAQPVTPQTIVNISPATAFTLHSRPGAPRVVYLNFRGETVTGKAWNYGRRSTYLMKPYSEDANPWSFSQAELNTIAEVWQRVSEDYAPFNIDVTTQRPAAFGPNVGHVLFSPRVDRNGFGIIDSAAGGIAWIDVWGFSYFAQYQPALVFPEGVPGAKNLSEAASHELGHNLGLSHDGQYAFAYYAGHGTGNVSWAPIMGVGYIANVSQWSKGEYPGATQRQDDIAIIASKLTLRPDDCGQTSATASPLALTNTGLVRSQTPVTLSGYPLNKTNRGVLGTRADIDMFAFTVSNAGVIDLTVDPAWRDGFTSTNLRSANLDIRASLLRDNGTPGGVLVTQNNPANDTYSRVVASVTPGRYLLRIEGVGAGTLSTGYSDYGSLGQYFISGRVPLPVLRRLTVSTPIASRGTVTGGGSFPTGTTQTVTATAKPGYRFLRWTLGAVPISTSPVYSFVLNGNTSLVAQFAAAAASPPSASLGYAL